VKHLLIITIVNLNQNTLEYQNPSRNKERKPLYSKKDVLYKNLN